MAQVTPQIGFFYDGSSVSISYDAQTFVVNSLTFTCSPTAPFPLTWWYETLNGDYNSGVEQFGQTTTITNFPKGFTGSLQLDKAGNSVPTFPFKFCGFGQGSAVTPLPPV